VPASATHRNHTHVRVSAYSATRGNNLRYAQQLEFTGSFDDALEHFERGVTNIPQDSANDATCKAGIVRMYLRKGEVRQGMDLAEELNSRQLWRDCGSILQSMDHLSEAAKAYSSGEQYDKAATMFIKLKNWKQISTILPHVKSAKIVLA
jgi:WD repeat-containing protein 19